MLLPNPSLTEDTTIRQMRPTDLSAAFALSSEIGWNQSPADWQRMLHMEPEGCFVAESAGKVIGTTLCCVFGTVAWLAMVILTPSHRGRGLARHLVQHGLDFAEQSGVTSVRLDATPLGEKVYCQVGFHPQFELVRMSGIPLTKSVHSSNPLCEIVVTDAIELSDVLQWDQLATRTDRSKLLRRLCEETPPLIAKSAEGRTIGFLARRQGRLAEQFGPCCGSQESSLTLLRQALQTSQGKAIIVDIPGHRADLLAIAEDFGLTCQRRLLRMCRGPAVIENEEYFHISYGGEFG